ncbi:hypothetical protein AB0N60_36200 [Streptomyces microflavus]
MPVGDALAEGLPVDALGLIIGVDFEPAPVEEYPHSEEGVVLVVQQ